jgi:hypothetical protein
MTRDDAPNRVDRIMPRRPKPFQFDLALTLVFVISDAGHEGVPVVLQVNVPGKPHRSPQLIVDLLPCLRRKAGEEARQVLYQW